MEEAHEFLCALCIESFASAAELEEHVEKKHQKELYG